VTTELTLLSRVSYRGQEITGPRMRGLLALLAADLRAGCSAAGLVDGLWPDEPPERPVKALQVLVSRARAQLGPGVIVSTPAGYRLSLRTDQVDAAALLLSASASARHARAGDHAGALAQADAGLALWDGAGGAGTVLDDPLSALRADRASAYGSLVRARALALSRLGRRSEAVEPLTVLARDRPRDEEVLLELLGCEAATAGPSTALARYEDYRRSVRDELGADPGAALQAVHQQLLRGDAPMVRRGVAHEPNPLLGRARDIAAVAELLRTSRVTSIVGAGGLGKTRLAHVVSRQAEQRAVHLVALAGVTTDDDVVREVASALGVGEARRTPIGPLDLPQDLLTGIVGALGPGPALLVLDNCEHVIGGAAGLVRALVSVTGDLRVLTTSRAPLGLSSESVYLLPELSLPTTVELFGQRARAARPGADLPAEVVQELCRHLDGLPLAAELAAARVRVMSVAEISRRLADRFTLLRGGARDAPRRHHTLHAVVDWSWNLLQPAGQAAMRALSVFPGGFTADAAGHLLGDGDVLRVLEDLVDQSLLKVADTPSGTRFRMLETVREFSTAQREAAAETDRVTGGFLAWARAFGLAQHESIFGADLVSSVARIRAEQDNLVLALRHGLDRRDGATVAATAAVLGGLWMVESNFTRLATLVQETAGVLARFRPGPALVEVTRTAAVLCIVSSLLLPGSRPARFLVTLRRLPPAPPTTVIRATEVVLRAVTASGGPDLPALQALCDSGDPLLAGLANGVASYVWESGTDPDRALAAARRMLSAFENRGTPWIRTVAHSRIGELCLLVERGDEARRHLSAALSVAEELAAWAEPAVARVRWAMVLACLQAGAIDEAEHWLDRTVQSGGVEEAGLLMFDVGVRAEILLARGDGEAGLRLWRRAADRLRNAPSPAAGRDRAGPEPWALEVQAVTVVAHARLGRLDLVQQLTGELPRTLSRMIARPAVTSDASLAHFPVCGALLLALALADLDRGERAGDERVTSSAAAMIALAERFRFLRSFQPTMSADRARRAAQRASSSAYDDAVTAYAGLGREDLRAAALAALRAREPG
jgi:predicted ATPase/DNA-binding SARP family transcriptional activator